MSISTGNVNLKEISSENRKKRGWIFEYWLFSNTGENLYPLLLEDYLACYLPIDPNLQSQLFTQPLPSALTTSPSPTIPSPTSSARKSARPSLFKKDFSPRMKAEEPRLDFNPVRNKWVLVLYDHWLVKSLQIFHVIYIFQFQTNCHIKRNLAFRYPCSCHCHVLDWQLFWWRRIVG